MTNEELWRINFAQEQANEDKLALIRNLKHEIAVLKKALELACGKNGYYIFLNARAVNKKQKIYAYFIDQARKELEDDK